MSTRTDTSSLCADSALPCAGQPVIILGMHRSGTSMVSQLLDELGLFVGRRLQDDHESTFFLELNEILFSRVGASWDNPLPVNDFLATEDAVCMTALALRADLIGRRGGKFFGRSSSNAFADFTGAWGWKDPRTVFTLPLWLRLFPQAKLVYIIRHGVDVAASLMVREKRLLELRKERFEARMRKPSLRSHLDRAGYKGSPRCLTLEGAFALWVEYVEQAERVMKGLPNALHTIRYEDFLSEPARHLAQLASWCELPVDERKIAAAAAKVNRGRALAFGGDPVLAQFSERVQADPWMQWFGYSTG